MRRSKLVQTLAVAWLILATTSLSFGAYHHAGEIDSVNFLNVYSDKAGTKLDSCNLCHTGGIGSSGKLMGNCQYCHDRCGYEEPHKAPFSETLNAYGRAYLDNGRNQAAIEAIKSLDSDGDGYSNQIEIAATRYPGDAKDDPSKIAAPYRVYTLGQLEDMTRHEQFLLMNTSKSGDFYAEYAGVPVSLLLKKARMLDSATGIIVYSPDGFATTHPLAADSNPSLYHVNGTYPQATFFYDEIAKAWCDYSAPSCSEHEKNAAIYNEGGLKLLLAFEREGQYLTTGVLTPQNKLDGEGPFRVVPPQKNPGPPDQPSTAPTTYPIWQYDFNADHNAGFSTRSATMIKVEPLPEGTTDIDIMEAGWNFVDGKKLIVYGAVDPLPTVKEKMKGFIGTLCALDKDAFKSPLFKGLFIADARIVQKMINKGLVKPALNNLQHLLMKKTDGCKDGEDADRNDWITDCEAQKQVYWSINEIDVLLKIAR